MKKFYSNQSIFAVVYLLLGIILLIHPMAVGKAVCYAMGIVALCYGAWRIYGYWKVREMAGFFQIDLITGVVLVVLGLIALGKPSLLISILPIILGLIILMDGLVTANKALNLRKLDYRWKYLMFSGIAIIVLGLVLVVNPFGSAMLMMRFLGITLIVDGVCEMWWYFGLKKFFEM